MNSIGLYPTSVEEEISIPIANYMSDMNRLPSLARIALPLVGRMRADSGPSATRVADLEPLPSPFIGTSTSLSSSLEQLPCGFRFHAAGREDVDVRMLGEGWNGLRAI